jgi:hypothetical protein
MVNSTTNELKVLAALTAADNNMGDDDGWVNGGQRCGRWQRATTWAKITV